MKRFLLACGLLMALDAPFAAHAAGTVVVQKGRAFHPAEISINRGETVTFTNEDSFIHQIFVTDLFDSEEKAPGQNLNEIFPAAGTFQVRCHIHPTMHMTVRVR